MGTGEKSTPGHLPCTDVPGWHTGHTHRAPPRTHSSKPSSCSGWAGWRPTRWQFRDLNPYQLDASCSGAQIFIFPNSCPWVPASPVAGTWMDKKKTKESGWVPKLSFHRGYADGTLVSWWLLGRLWEKVGHGLCSEVGVDPLSQETNDKKKQPQVTSGWLRQDIRIYFFYWKGC